ncbi:hypothetical protein [Vibrio sp. MA40-2]|uniref:hypothetical protein n=1 Tax=Vibrio sp. MA40-2 TaxID=3391828 RepID=UPI0039A6156D
MTNESLPIWHQGELTIQQWTGTTEKMAHIGPRFIREFLQQQHRDFFESLTMIFIGYEDRLSGIQASVLFGDSGFIQSITETELRINTQNSIGDFILDALDIGDRIGLLGIEFNSKRRNRANGIIIDSSQKYITVKILQSYGNCPKYIQPKTLLNNHRYGDFSNVTRYKLQPKDLTLITNADSLFIASSFNDGKHINNRGSDISHRGGNSGFVSTNSNGQLIMQDYVGNGFFNTLGNLHENPIATLLFLDWQNGHVLKIMAKSEIFYDKNILSGATQTTGITLCFTPKKIEYISNSLAYLTKTKLI